MAHKTKNTITKRWAVNSLGVVIAVLLLVVLAAAVFVNSYYTSGARQYITNRMNTLSGILKQYYTDSPVTFPDEVHSMIENWSDRNKTELMAINKNGEIVMTSSGFEISSDIIADDYYNALDSGNMGYFLGKSATGERIIAVTALTPDRTGNYSAVRLVSSFEGVYRTIIGYIIAMAAVFIAIITLMVFSGMYFINSIVIPVRQVGQTAKRYAHGDFSVRITKGSDDELGELCDIINHMAEELAMSEKMKNDFISSVSHELRTPLTAIKGWAETIASMPDDKETIVKGMKVINTEAERLSQMVEELLDFSRMQNGKFTLNKAKMDILAELGDAVLIYTEKARKENIDISYDEPEMLPFINGDKNRMRQVFINIIDNAIKYSDKGGHVAVQAVQSDKDHIEIAVSDTGCGISAQDIPKIKTKFYKANHTRRGSGIGLAVADEIVSMHGGKLEIFSEEGKGTTVVITLPVLKENKSKTG